MADRIITNRVESFIRKGKITGIGRLGIGDKLETLSPIERMAIDTDDNELSKLKNTALKVREAIDSIYSEEVVCFKTDRSDISDSDLDDIFKRIGVEKNPDKYIGKLAGLEFYESFPCTDGAAIVQAEEGFCIPADKVDKLRECLETSESMRGRYGELQTVNKSKVFNEIVVRKIQDVMKKEHRDIYG